MKNQSTTVLATDDKGIEINPNTLKTWVTNKSKIELANFFYHRFYGRYIKPFDFKNKEYINEYKNGFAIMTSCCLLIETYTSFAELAFLNTNHKSEKTFGYFFLKNIEFQSFSKNGLQLNEYLSENRIKNKGIPSDFYKNVRCGILHNGETRNGWKIVRNGPLFDENSKRINSVLFLEKLKNILINFKTKLIASDFDNSEIWKTYRSRIEILIEETENN